MRQIAVLGILVVMRMRGVSSRAQTMQIMKEMSAVMRIIGYLPLRSAEAE